MNLSAPPEEENELQIQLSRTQLKKLGEENVKAMISRLPGLKKTLAVVKLFQGRESWEVVSQGCMFLVDHDKRLSFHLLNHKTAEIIWSHELYENIVINLQENFFAHFEGVITDDKTKKTRPCSWGFSFAHIYNGKEFVMRTMDAVRERYPQKKKTSVFTGIKNWWGSRSKKKKKKKPERIIISSPKNFKKTKHIGNLDIPSEWMKFLTEELKFTSTDLNSPETIDRLFRILERFSVSEPDKSDNPSTEIIGDVSEEQKLREEMELQKELEDLDNKILQLTKRKNQIISKLKKIRTSNHEEEEEEEQEDSEDFFGFEDAEEEEWERAGLHQGTSEFPPKTPPPPPPLPQVIRSGPSQSTKRRNNNNTEKNKKRELPKLTKSLMDLLRENVIGRRDEMGLDDEEEIEENKEKKVDKESDWSDDEKEED